MAIIRPDNDILTTGWSSTGGSFYTEIDETSASDADYVESSTVGAKCRVGLETAASLGTTPTLTYRAASPDSGNGLIARVIESGSFPFIIPQRKVWTRQPQRAVDADHSIVKWNSVILPVAGLNAVDVVRKSALTYSSITPDLRRYGRAISNTSTGSGYVDGDGICGGQTFSRIAVITINSLSSDAVVSESTNASTTGGAQWKLISSTGEMRLAKNYVYGFAASSGAALASGSTHTIGITYDGATARYFVDGRAIGSASGAYTFTIGSKGRLFKPGYVPGGSGFNGMMGLHADCVGAIPPNYMCELTRNPWRIFKPRSIPIYVDPGCQVIAERTPSLSSSPANYTIELTNDEKAKVIDPANLGLEFEAT